MLQIIFILIIIGVLRQVFFPSKQDKSDQRRTQGGGFSGGSYQDFYKQRVMRSNFPTSLMLLSAAVMKADGKVVKSELDYVKKFFINQFGTQASGPYFLELKDILKRDVPLRQACEDISAAMQPEVRLQLLHYLFGISKADGHVSESEVKTIARISNFMGISNADFMTIRAMFYKDPNTAYRILGLSESASVDEIKKAYRKLVITYHPDKVQHLGPELQKGAKDKFQKIQEAYDTIKKQRGIK